MSRPLVGLALIAKDEQANLPRLLASIEGAFDRVVLLDTGSTDETAGIFNAWARQQIGMTFAVAEFNWCHDFAAARNAADALLVWGSAAAVSQHPPSGASPLVDWTCWADCDDTIRHPEALRELAASAPADVAAFICGYEYGYDHLRRVVCHLRRERLVRAELAGSWAGRVHEAQTIERPGFCLQAVPDEVVCWEHHKHDDPDAPVGVSNDRNLHILYEWAQDEPDNARVLAYLGTETMAAGRPEEATGWFGRYLALKTEWDDERAQVHRKLAQALLMLGQLDSAEIQAQHAMSLAPAWPDSYLTMAEVALGRGEWEKVIHWAERVQQMGPPSTLLIIQPLEYTFRPRMLRAIAASELGDLDRAVALAEEAFQFGDDHTLRQGWARWKAGAKREHTANTYVMMAQQLVAHDEQLKALALLEAVPVFAIDHPKVVECRSWVRERIRWIDDPAAFYQETYDPENEVPDEALAHVGAQLPRARFLADGLLGQLRAAA